MGLLFPSSPNNSDVYEYDGIKYVWDETFQCWFGGGAAIPVSDGALGLVFTRPFNSSLIAAL